MVACYFHTAPAGVQGQLGMNLNHENGPELNSKCRVFLFLFFSLLSFVFFPLVCFLFLAIVHLANVLREHFSVAMVQWW